VTAPGGIELNKDVLVRVGNDVVEVGGSQNGDIRRRRSGSGVGTSLLVNELDQIVDFAATLVLLRGGGALGEELEGREALNFEAASEVLVLVSINLGNQNVGELGKSGTELLILCWSKTKRTVSPV
jgi:hypothetical protein